MNTAITTPANTTPRAKGRPSKIELIAVQSDSFYDNAITRLVKRIRTPHTVNTIAKNMTNLVNVADPTTLNDVVKASLTRLVAAGTISETDGTYNIKLKFPRKDEATKAAEVATKAAAKVQREQDRAVKAAAKAQEAVITAQAAAVAAQAKVDAAKVAVSANG